MYVKKLSHLKKKECSNVSFKNTFILSMNVWYIFLNLLEHYSNDNIMS